MNAEQKQRAAELLAAWRATTYALHADRMAELLQELVDAPEAEPVAEVAAAICSAPQPEPLSDERIAHHLDAILKASGSGLKNYSIHKTIEDMKQAVRAIEREILGVPEK